MKNILISLCLLFSLSVYSSDKNSENIKKKIKDVKNKSSKNYIPKNGDIIFQTLKSTLSLAIQKATKSKYSHVGVIYIKNNKPFVYEAIGPVKFTPLKEWINKGEGKKFVVKRILNAKKILTKEAIKKLMKIGSKFKGKEYDSQFKWSDDKIYCSELVWKMYKQAFNIEIGKLEKVDDFDFSDPIVKKEVKKRFGNSIPKNETAISPKSMFYSDKLITVYNNY